MKYHTLAAATLVAGIACAIPARGDAQIWKKVKEGVSQKVGARKQKADSTIVQTAAGAVDSTLATGSRAVEAGSAKLAAGADTAINRTERGVANAFRGSGDKEIGALVAADLKSAGRAVVPELEFAPGSANLVPSSEPALKAIAKVLRGGTGAFLIEGHVDASADAAADQELSGQRAAAVKKRLIALGVPAARLFASGYGSTRPLPPTASAAPGSPGADSAAKTPSKASMAKTVATSVVPGAGLIGMGAKALKARRGKAQADSAQAAAPAAQKHARIEIARMQ